MIPTKVIKAIFQENVFFMEIWVSRCIDQCLAVLPGHGSFNPPLLILHVVGEIIRQAKAGFLLSNFLKTRIFPL